MKDDFLTFSEFAKLAKVNRSTVYRRVAKTVALQQLVQQLATGQKLINRSALRFFTVAECCNDATTCNSSRNNSQQVPQKADVSENQKLVEFLMAQIEMKDKQIEELHKLLDQQQQLQLVATQQVQQLMPHTASRGRKSWRIVNPESMGK